MAETKMIDDVAQVAAGGVSFGGGLYMARWLILWLTGRADRKQALIDEQEAKVDREWATMREELKAERQADKLRLDRIEKQNQALRFAFHHVAAALIRIDPQNPALSQAEQMLSQAFPLDFSLIAERAAAAVEVVALRD